MPLPQALQGKFWTQKTARAVLPLLVWLAKHGKTISYGHLDREIVKRGLGVHAMAINYGYPAGAIGNALIETEKEWGHPIPPLNALVVNAKDGLPGEGVNYYLKHYSGKDVNKMSKDEKKAVVKTIHKNIYAYKRWDELLKKYDIDGIVFDEPDEIARPSRGGWSPEGESEEHKALKMFVAENPSAVGLPKNSKKGEREYLFASGDKADVVFSTKNGFLGVEVKSIISNDTDLNRGLFQAVKYQALLRSEQKAALSPPTARAVLVTERKLPISLQNLADILGISVYVVPINR